MARPDILLINPTTVQLGEMEKGEDNKILVPIATGRNGRGYFRFGSGEQLLGGGINHLSGKIQGVLVIY